MTFLSHMALLLLALLSFLWRSLVCRLCKAYPSSAGLTCITENIQTRKRRPTGGALVESDIGNLNNLALIWLNVKLPSSAVLVVYAV